MGSGLGSDGFRLGSKSLKSFKLVFFSWVPPSFHLGQTGFQTVELVQTSIFFVRSALVQFGPDWAERGRYQITHLYKAALQGCLDQASGGGDAEEAALDGDC